MPSKSTEDMLDTLNNPRWTLPEQDPAKTPVTLDCVHNGVPGVFIASPNDPEDYGRQVWQDCIDGKYGKIGPYVAPAVTVSETMSTQTRNAQVYFQGAIGPMEPGEDRRLVFTEIQAAFTVNGSYMAQIPPPWDRPVTPADQVLFDQGEQAIIDTINYLNGLPPPVRIKLPPFTRRK